MSEFTAGKIVTVEDYPFIRTKFETFDEDGSHFEKSWKPGVEIYETPYGTSAIANGKGKMTMTIVDIIKPGRFPTRVFYTREFVAPDGKRFGKRGLKICTLEKFRRLARGYRFYFDVDETAELTA